MNRLLLMLVALAACAPSLPITTAPSRVQPLDPATPHGGLQLLGFETLEVRSEIGGDEVEGATCTLTSALWSGIVTTPAALTVPEYGPRSPDITALCSRGEARGTQTVEMQDTRDPEEMSGVRIGTNGDEVGVGIRIAVPITQRDPADIFDYPDIVVRMR